MRKYFLNKKYKMLLFFPLFAVAIFYLIGATEISYILNIPMKMTAVRTGMNAQSGRAAVKHLNTKEIKTASQNTNKTNFQSYITCLECQNLPAARYKSFFYSGSFIETISFQIKKYGKLFYTDIVHPPKTNFI